MVYASICHKKRHFRRFSGRNEYYIIRKSRGMPYRFRQKLIEQYRILHYKYGINKLEKKIILIRQNIGESSLAALNR